MSAVTPLNPDVAALEALWVGEVDAPEGSPAWHAQRAREAFEAHRGQAEAKGPRFVLESARDLVLTPIAPLVWIVFGILPERSVIAISGEPKTSKTWLAVSIAVAVSAGQRLFSEFGIGPMRRVVYAALEDSRRSLRTRFVAIARGMGLEPAVAVENIRLQAQTSLNVLSDRDLCDLAAACQAGGGVDLLFIDPFRDAHSAQENDSGEMQEVMKRLRFLRDYLECSIVFVHHTSKQGPETSKRRSGQRMRGSTSIHGAVDGGIYMQLTKASACEWINTIEVELKAAKGAGTFGLTLNVDDDVNNEATCARWTFAREVTPKGQVELAEDVARLVAWLRSRYQRNKPGQRGANREAIRADLNVRTARVTAIVAEATRQGRAAFSKNEGGTVYVPAIEDES